ncbi:MAG: chemoreceptor glutamine deamidase CheD [Holosporales bacterium]|jgi:chemotaxis protein CheD
MTQTSPPVTDSKVIKIISGEWHVCTQPGEMLVTILGSCIAACIRDPFCGVGGMNHFLLPGEEGSDNKISESTRYGVFAMETLINSILNAGGRKDRLEVKVFGGGNVLRNSTRIGSKNAAFIRQFLKKEGYTIACEDMEGDTPRKVHYYPHTGKVMLRRLPSANDVEVAKELQDEERYRRTLLHKPVVGNIDLF